MAERGEAGPGRLAEVPQLIEAIEGLLGVASAERAADGPLAGRHVLVTSGPTHEPIDPVRYIANRSSGKQGAAIAAEAARLGARVTLVTGPVSDVVSGALPAGVDGGQGRDGLGDAGGRARGASRRRRHLRRRRGRLARRPRGASRSSRSAARRRPGWSWSRTPTSSRPSPRRPSASGPRW